jgi:ABC-type sulfate transport system permease component
VRVELCRQRCQGFLLLLLFLLLFLVLFLLLLLLACSGRTGMREREKERSFIDNQQVTEGR